MSITGIESSAATATLSLATSTAPVVSGQLTSNVTALIEISPDKVLPGTVSPNSPSTQLPTVPDIAVTIGRAIEPDFTYSSLGQVSATSTAWAQPPTDATSKLMESNLQSYSRSGRLSSLLNGLGSEVLGGLAARGRQWQQTAAVYRPGYRELGSPSATSGTTAVDALSQAGEGRNTINLKILTVSGKEVDVAIVFGGNGKAVQDGLSVDIRVSKDLDAAEQAAIDKFAKGLDTALQRISGDVPKVDVAGLVDFDTSVIAGVDLKLNVVGQKSGLQSFEFRADATGRSLNLQTTGGRLALNVDFTAAAPLGSAEQQKTAVEKFLAQFDKANARAHGEELLLQQFKAAFSQLNSSYPPPEALPAPKLSPWVLSDEDRSVLSGLADFQASMSGDFDNGSPDAYITEAGHLRYEVSQATEVKGTAKDSGLSVLQTQTAALNATQDRSPDGSKLNKESGNYDVFRIADKTTTTTAFEYDDYGLNSASSEENSSRLDEYEKWRGDQMVEHRSTPYNTRVLRDLVEELSPRS